MYCSHLSALQGLLNDDQIQSLETYFSNLIGGAAKNITVSKLSRALNISPQVASGVFNKMQRSWNCKCILYNSMPRMWNAHKKSGFYC